MAKISCTNPDHADSTPSMEIYEDGGWCFSCGYLDTSVADTDAPTREPEDIVSTIRYIKSLPTKTIRGLDLPYDSLGYYILWPSNDYYKRRNWDDKPRYKAPTGHTQPLFSYESTNKSTLILIEGELNAMSLYMSVGPVCTIASPGPASNFDKCIRLGCNFYTIYAILDKDAAGVAAGIHMKRELLKAGRRINLICLEQDFNETLQERGPEGLKKAFRQTLGL